MIKGKKFVEQQLANERRNNAALKSHNKRQISEIRVLQDKLLFYNTQNLLTAIRRLIYYRKKYRS